MLEEEIKCAKVILHNLPVSTAVLEAITDYIKDRQA